MIAIIPARGGSKGLPGKNLKELNGKPMIGYTIEAALNSEFVSRIIVSTDDDNIANVARSFNAEIPFMRPDFLATDNSKSIDVYQYTINRLEEDEDTEINEFVVLQPTSPLRNSHHIDEAIDLFRSRNADSVISYCQEEHPIFWHKYIDQEMKFEEIFEGDFLKNRQEIRPTYYPNGAIYIFKKKLMFNGSYHNSNSYAYVMDRKVSIDIDTIDDFEYVEYLMSKFRQTNF